MKEKRRRARKECDVEETLMMFSPEVFSPRRASANELVFVTIREKKGRRKSNGRARGKFPT